MTVRGRAERGIDRSGEKYERSKPRSMVSKLSRKIGL